MKTCTYCGKEHSDEALACAVDGQPLQPVLPPRPIPAVEEKHSALGIASFAISIAAGCLTLGLFAVASFLNAGRLQRGQTYPGQILVGLTLIFLWAVNLMAAGLGIAALCQKDRKRLFGLLGLVFSSGMILGSMVLVFMGLMYSAKLHR